MTPGSDDDSDRDRALAPVRAVLFDLGGVLTTGPWEGFAAYERANGLPVGLIRQMNSTNPDSNAWARFERGEVDFAAFCELFAAEGTALGHRVDAVALTASMGGEMRPEMVEAVRFCGQRFKTAALTNNFAPTDGERREEAFGVFRDLFDVVIESSKEGVRKPDPRFYELACRTLGVEPTESVFLDDLGVNLKPARAMGMRTIKVVTAQQALTELYDILGVAPEGWPPEPAA